MNLLKLASFRSPHFRSGVILSILLLSVFCQCCGQNHASKIDKKDLKHFIKTLSSVAFEGRAIDNNGQFKTQEFIIDRLKKLKIEPFSTDGYLDKFTLNLFDRFDGVNKNIETANVMGVIPGESKKTIIISAHYDHIGTEDNLYFPGADDNASGVAALLELAEEFVQYKNLKYSMMFMATSAEEVGLLGSQYYVNKPDFDPENIVCCINLDMISRCDNQHTDCDYLYCISSNHSASLDSIVREANRLFPNCTFDFSGYDSSIIFRTDAYNFSQKGVPSLLFFTGFHDDYHKSTDTVEKINFDILTNRVKLIGKVVKLLQDVN